MMTTNSRRDRRKASSARRSYLLRDDFVLAKGWITVKDASKKYKHNAEYLRRLIRQGKIKAEQFPGSRVFVIEEQSLIDYDNDMKSLGNERFNAYRDTKKS
jgi:lysophospholipase L1-like esterase